uniref:Uncharacterized protein n=1 Tax=Brassica oleracea TaxID=3712 RepID=A0A3P6AVB7_BRAOL|nr:unnamed protein product [Brassica oleracea]
MAEKRFEYRYVTEEELEELKHREFSGWMFTYVSAGMTRGETFDDWIREMVRGAEYIMEIKYPDMVGLRCTIFYCDWYDNTPDRGVRTYAFGVTSVHSLLKVAIL